MTREQLRKIRNAGYKYWDNEVFENHSDWSKREIAQFSFEAGAKYALANKYDELKEQSRDIVQFLKDNGVYEMFFANLLNQKQGEVLCLYFSRYFYEPYAILAAFTWKDTPERHTFWEEISEKWNKRF